MKKVSTANYNVPVNYEPNIAVVFKDFEITYKETTHWDFAPASLSGDDSIFLVKDSDGFSQELIVTSGQLPPMPQEFIVQKKVYTLYTFKTPLNERLGPNQILVSNEGNTAAVESPPIKRIYKSSL
jgi:hypothetical protein